MHRRIAVVVVALLTSVLSVAQNDVTHEQPNTTLEWGKKTNQVAIAIAVPKRVYRLDEPIQFQIAREDFGASETVYVGECDEVGVELRDADMNRITAAGFPQICLGHGWPQQPFPRNKVVWKEFSLRDITLQPIFPGTYNVVATWSFSSDTWPDRVCAPHCTATIYSDPIELRVVDPEHTQTRQSPWPTIPTGRPGPPRGFEQVDTAIGPRTALEDQRSGLKWLHLNLTAMSHARVTEAMQGGGWLHGWRYATPDEVRALFAHYTQTTDGKSRDPRIAARFQNDMGGPISYLVNPRTGFGRTSSDAILPLPCTLNQGRTPGYTIYGVIMNDSFTGAQIDPDLYGCTMDGVVGTANYLVQEEKPPAR